jgi:uncharacterized membrane protein
MNSATAMGFRWSKARLLTLAALGLASAVSVGMFAARWAYTGAPTYRFLVWNLFLAWVPLVCAFTVQRWAPRRGRSWASLPVAACAGVWLLFFPNAPYIATDLLHLRVSNNSLFWYDLILLLSFAWTGCFLGFVSLHAMQRWVERLFGGWSGWALLVLMAGVSGFGIYMGRFLRWNSWDLLLNPVDVLLDIWARFRHPFAHTRTFAFALAFSAFFMCAYLLLTAFAGLRHERDA